MSTCCTICVVFMPLASQQRLIHVLILSAICKCVSDVIMTTATLTSHICKLPVIILWILFGRGGGGGGQRPQCNAPPMK